MKSSIYLVSLYVSNAYFFIFFEAKLSPGENAQWIEAGQCAGHQTMVNQVDGP